MRACAFYAPRQVENRIFCEGGTNPKINATYLGISQIDFDWFNTFSYWPATSVLQELRGHALCDRMIREMEVREESKYKWILRLRADWAFFAPFPEVSTIQLQDNVVLMRSGSDDGDAGASDSEW